MNGGSAQCFPPSFIGLLSVSIFYVRQLGTEADQKTKVQIIFYRLSAFD
jgi:hypothetical protein